MLDSRDFRSLMKQITEGSEEAAWTLVEEYGELIRRAVRRVLNKKLRSKFDSLDFVQLVWSSFFRARNRLDRFEHPEQLAAFLLTIARNKVGMEVRRRLLTEKYNLNKEYSLNAPSMIHRDISDPKPLPIDVAMAREQWNRLLSGQPNHYREIIKLRLQGRTYQDIAAKLAIDESTVRRFLNRLFIKEVA
ncbi:MAG: sigma-70 family RNA polymerase sigma factor [Thermoguttaceae bacterium]|jgi:RNA polymerase sigma-70 factor (ECF subfamily)